MSHKQISHSPDLKKLRDEGLDLEIRGAYLLVHHIPYVTASREIAYGTLVSSLTLSSGKTSTPDTHVIHFIGEHPCNADGSRIQSIVHSSGNQTLDATLGIIVNHSFSNKPAGGFKDYYEKVMSYIRVISSQAAAIDDGVKAPTFKVIESKENESVFKYLDTNSSRAEINVITAKLENLKIAIVGLGGTGSYVLDFTAKTPVREIHLFDKDLLLDHNAFRSPGAASLQELEAQPKKVNYLHGIYSNMRDGIIPHEYHLCAANADELNGFDFVFICVDDGPSKRTIIDKLAALGIAFCDVGMGVQAIDNALTGCVRTTTGTAKQHAHIAGKISFADTGENDYALNIQIAELNALNAAYAVIKWKKLLGFYHDLEHEYHSVYEINTGKVVNDDFGP